MATISPDRSNSADRIPVVLWETLTESDTATSIQLTGPEGARASVQVIGTFGSATVILQGSNDGTNWVGLKDSADGSAISFTAAGAAEFGTAMRYIRPSASGGTGQDVDVYVTLRG